MVGAAPSGARLTYHRRLYPGDRILVAARVLFRVPMLGSMGLLFRALMVFIAANLAVGFTFSTIVRGIMLKANTVLDILPHVWPISLFLLVAATVALPRDRETLN